MSKSDIAHLLDNPGHHAYLIVGNIEVNYEGLRLAVRERVLKQNFEPADIWSRTFENLNIDDGREIKEVHNTRPIGKRRVVLFSLQTIQNEAQNSLLKLFEDPQSDTVFFVCVPNTEIFLPTVLSRFSIIQANHGEADEQTTLVQKFLSGTIKQRFDLIEPIVKEKDKVLAEKFLNSLETVLHGKSVVPTVFEDIFSARRFLRSRAPSIKMILENLCGIVPVLKGVTKS